MREREEEKDRLREQKKRKRLEEQNLKDCNGKDTIKSDDIPQSSNKRPKLHHDESLEQDPVADETDVLGTSSQNEKLAKDESQQKAASAKSSFDEKENAPAPPPLQSPEVQANSAGRKRRSSWLDEPSNLHQVNLSGPSNNDEPQIRQKPYQDRYPTALQNKPLLPLEAITEAAYPRPPPTTKLTIPAQRPTATKRPAHTQPLPPEPIPQRNSLSQPPPPLKPILRPLHLTPLSSLPTLPKKQNALLDILALITHTSPQTIKRPNMPLKRDIRLCDLSTPKRVSLSVFVDAETFLPEVGTVAVFRGVRNHRWDGGSLNAYPGDCEGFKWFLPVGGAGEGMAMGMGVEGGKVVALREWWRKEKEKERVEEERQKAKQGKGDGAEKVRV